MKRQRYHDGTEIHAGDSAYYNGCPVTVAFVVDHDEYTKDYPKEEWPDIRSGFMLIFTNGARLLLDEADEHFTKSVNTSPG